MKIKEIIWNIVLTPFYLVVISIAIHQTLKNFDNYGFYHPDLKNGKVAK